MAGKGVQLPARPLKPGQCRRWLRRALAEQLPGMVQSFVDSKAKVSAQDIKLVMGLLEETEKKKRGRRFVDRLLEDLRREEAAEGRAGTARERDALGRWVRK
jgi:hypothetical protein